MEWHKLKNIILLILLVVNGFLLVLVGSRRKEDAEYERRALEQTVQVLERSGIQVRLEAVDPADGLSPSMVERDLEREAQLARALLGQTAEADNRGGGLYFYRSDEGELSVRAGGELSAKLEGGGQTDHPERRAAELLKKMGIDAEQIDVAEEGEWTRVRFRQLWNGAAVFSCEIEFAYKNGVLDSIQGSLLTAQAGTAEAGQVLTLPTALMRFSEAVGATGDVCSAIQSMEPGWRGTVQPMSGGVRLAPAWLVTTDTARYYLDCATGALTRIPDP